MYKIQYQDYSRKALCYFTDYNLAMKCLSELKKKNPETIIELLTIQPITCYEEFSDVVGDRLN